MGFPWPAWPHLKWPGRPRTPCCSLEPFLDSSPHFLDNDPSMSPWKKVGSSGNTGGRASVQNSAFLFEFQGFPYGFPSRTVWKGDSQKGRDCRCNIRNLGPIDRTSLLDSLAVHQQRHMGVIALWGTMGRTGPP